jgi:hypothetical protein
VVLMAFPRLERFVKKTARFLCGGVSLSAAFSFDNRVGQRRATYNKTAARISPDGSNFALLISNLLRDDSDHITHRALPTIIQSGDDHLRGRVGWQTFENEV